MNGRIVPVAAVAAVASLLVACSGAADTVRDPETTASPTTPPPDDTTTTPSVPSSHGAVTAAPGCGKSGEKVILRLGWTDDKRVPECVRPDDFEVTFGGKLATVLRTGTNNDGYCTVEAFIPKGAGSGGVKVKVARDVFETTSQFEVPCH